jgi:hypothetical protein
MAVRRYAKRTDQTQASIVKALRRAGWHVWVIHEPVDLLCWKPGRGFRVLECKTPTKGGRIRIRKDQAAQNGFIELTGTPRVADPFEALLKLGEKVEL